MQHIVCYSGGHSSALVAVEVVRKYGKKDVVLLNHNINPFVEVKDIKRFKLEVANYLGVEITPCDMPGWDTKDQFDVVVEAGAFKVGNGTALCTNRLKTRPFERWLEANAENGAVIYYGFDANEPQRIQRRWAHIKALGFESAFPLAQWPRTIQAIEEIGIRRPSTYETFKHANCIGCLKAGRQHWYVVYCTRPDVWERGLWAEDEIGYTIIKGASLDSLVPLFERMKKIGIEPTEHIPPGTFWSGVKKKIKLDFAEDEDTKPCECAA
jgi:hypothetical protein